MHKTDVAIIGAGPVGLFAVFQAGMLGMKSVVVDALDFAGGQCAALYPQKPIYDIPAYPKIDGQDLVNKLMEQNSPFKPHYIFADSVQQISKTPQGWLLVTQKGEQIEAKVIFISAGAGAFGPNKPPLDNINEFENKSVFYLVSDKNKFKDKTVLIGGGGDSAIDWAIDISSIAKKVYIVHRRDKFRAMQASIDKMQELVSASKIELVIPYQISGIEGSNGQVTKAILTDLDNNEKALECDYMLLFYGLKMELGHIASWGLDIDKTHLKANQSSMMTNLEGVYAIGDIATYEGKLKLILCGFSEAATACHHAYKYVFPDKALHFEYSTTKGIT